MRWDGCWLTRVLDMVEWAGPLAGATDEHLPRLIAVARDEDPGFMDLPSEARETSLADGPSSAPGAVFSHEWCQSIVLTDGIQARSR